MKNWKFWLGVGVGLACLAYVASTIKNPRSFADALLAANYLYLIPITAAYFLIMAIRAVRWRYILNHVGHVGFINTLAAILVCYMGNNIFPLRAGELMRVFLIAKREPSVPLGAALATVVVERLFDFLVVLCSLAGALLIIPFPEGGLVVTIGADRHDLAAAIRGLGLGTMAAAVVLFAGLVLLNARRELALRLAGRGLGLGVATLHALGKKAPALGRLLADRPDRLEAALLAALERFASGLSIMGRPRALFTLAGVSLLIWAVNLTPVWLSGLAFPEIGAIDFKGVVFLLVVGAAAASIPGPPGFFGVFHAFNQAALIFYLGLAGRAVSPDTALSFAIILHACYYFPTIIAGAIAAWAQGYSLAKLHDQAG